MRNRTKTDRAGAQSVIMIPSIFIENDIMK